MWRGVAETFSWSEHVNMGRWMRSLLSVLIAALTLPGCGGQDPSRMPQDTPRRTLEKMARALDVGNTEAFLECWEVPPEQRELLSRAMDMIVARRKLEGAAVEKFGKTAWESAGRKYGMKQQPKNPIGVLKLDRMEVKIEGDNATVTTGGDKPRKLVRREGIWRVTGAGLPKGENARRAGRMMKGFAGAMTMALTELESGATADAVRRTMFMETMKVIMTPAIEAMKETPKEKE